MSSPLIPLAMDYDFSFPEVVSSSTIGQYASCPLKFFYGTILNLTPRTTNIHLNAGAALAASLNTFRRHYYAPDSEKDIDLCLAYALQTLVEEYVRGAGELSHSQWDEMNIDVKGLPNMAVALVAYVDNFNPADPYGLHPYVDPTGEVWAERSFTFPTQVGHPVTGQPILYSGRVDWIGEHNGYKFVVDEKTTKAMGKNWTNQWNLRGQFIGYTLGFLSSFPEVAGTWVRGINLLKESIRFAEHPVNVPVWLIRDWWTDLNYMLADAVRDWERGHFRSDRGSACTQYSGCQFQSICKIPSDQRHSFARPLFTQARYNPLTGEREELS